LQGGLSSLRLRWDHDFCLAVPTSSNCSSWSLASISECQESSSDYSGK
jgi:hypothetical protein